MHLQRAIAATHGDAPLTVAEQLDLVVAGLLDVEFEQHVLVVADAVGLDLGQYLACQRRNLGSITEDALPLAAAAADRFQAKAAARLFGQDSGGLGAQRFAQLVDRYQVDPLPIRCLQQRLRHLCQGRLLAYLHVERVRPCALRQCGAVRILRQQSAHRRVVHSRRHRHLVLDRGPLGLVLCARRRLRERARTNEAQSRFFEGTHELRILGHEAIPGEDVLVAVLFADRDDLLHARHAFVFGGAAVVRDGMHELRVHLAQLRRQRARVHGAVLLRQQHANVVDSHLMEDVDRFLADRPTAHDQDAHLFAGEGARPLRRRQPQAAIAVHHRLLRKLGDGHGLGHQWNSRWIDCIGPGV